MNTEIPLSFDLLYQDYSLHVYRWAYRMLGHRQAAEDASQETFLRAWRYLGNFDPEKGALTSWLYRITVQVIRNQQGHATQRSTRTALAGKWLPRGGNCQESWQDNTHGAQLAREWAQLVEAVEGAR